MKAHPNVWHPLCFTHPALSRARVEHRHRLQKTLERKFPGLNAEQFFQRYVDPLTDENLAPKGISAQAGGEIGDRTNGPVIDTPFEADHAKGGMALGNAHSKVERARVAATERLIHASADACQ